MSILWMKGLHVFFMVAWFAGIFYLPRLFVYHATVQGEEANALFKVMERRLWLFITPFMLLTLAFGLGLVYQYGLNWLRHSPWLHLKLLLVFGVVIYHFYLWHLVKVFARDENRRSARFYRILNETPVLILLAIILLAVLKPNFSG